MIHPVLRLATADDLEAVRALIVELGYPTDDLPGFASTFARVLADPAQQVWLAEMSGDVVGLVSLGTRPQVRLGGVVVSVDELVVAERSRGRQVGTALIEHAKAEAKRVGARRLELHTARSRESYARGFYVKNGFAEVDSAVMRWLG